MSTGMQVKSLLNKFEKHKGFVYKSVKLGIHEGQECIKVQIRPRRGSKAKCSGCGQKGSCYDTLPERLFSFVPLWGLVVFFLYSMRRVNCPDCGVTVEQVPWGSGKRRVTNSYAWFLAGWAKRLSWKETAVAFRTSWYTVFRSVEMAVDWGRERIDVSNVLSLGIDEIQWQLGHHYLTLVYQIDVGCRRLLWVGEGRETRTLLRFFNWLGKEQSAKLEFVCSDLWKPYLTVIEKKAGQAVNVLDRFHLIQRINRAVDEVRAGEAKKLQAGGYQPLLKGARWCLLKREENLTDAQSTKLSELLQYNLKSVRAFLLKEQLDQLWTYVSPAWAGKFLDQWCTRVMRSRIEPMKKIALSVRRHRPLILNWFHAKGQISNGVVEGFNNKAKLTTKRAYGFRTFRGAEIALLHTLGSLPEPKMTHKYF